MDVDDTYLVKFKKTANGKLLYEHNGEFIEPTVFTETIRSKDSEPQDIKVLYVNITTLVLL